MKKILSLILGVTVLFIGYNARASDFESTITVNNQTGDDIILKNYPNINVGDCTKVRFSGDIHPESGRLVSVAQSIPRGGKEVSFKMIASGQTHSHIWAVERKNYYTQEATRIGYLQTGLSFLWEFTEEASIKSLYRTWDQIKKPSNVSKDGPSATGFRVNEARILYRYYRSCGMVKFYPIPGRDDCSIKELKVTKDNPEEGDKKEMSFTLTVKDPYSEKGVG